MVAHAGLHAASTAAPLLLARAARQLLLQHRRASRRVESREILEAGVDDVDDVRNGDGGLRNVCGEHDLAS